MSYQRLVTDGGNNDKVSRQVNPKVDKSKEHKHEVQPKVDVNKSKQRKHAHEVKPKVDKSKSTKHKHDVKPKVDPSTQIRHLIFLESLQARNSKPSSKMQSKLGRAAAAIYAGLNLSSTNIKHKSKLFRLPASQVKRLRDGYVSFMMSLAGNNNSKMTGHGIIYGSCSWPCSVESGKYPGRKPRIEKSEEEMAYIRDLYVESTLNGPPVTKVARSPACGRKAIYPL